jgi:hypothetical protein
MHPPEPEIAKWAHAEMFVTADPQHPFRHARGLADFRQIERAVVTRLKEFFQLRDNRGMAHDAGARFDGNSIGQATDHRMN